MTDATVDVAQHAEVRRRAFTRLLRGLFAGLAGIVIASVASATPTVPAGLTAVAASSTQLQLTWTASTGTPAIAAYTIKRCAGSGCTSFAPVATVTGSTGWLDSMLTPAGTYRYEVAATDTAGTISAPSTAVTATTLPTSVGGGVTYGYDVLGRLVQATIPSLNAVQSYSYDPSGNLTGVNSTPVATLAVTGLSTPTAAPGSALTVFGSGFSTTASANTVTINGVAATVVSATSTQLLVTVPGGMSAGSVTVRVGSSSVTGTQTFTPRVVSGAPTIASFLPTAAAAGSVVTINGTGFMTAPGATKVRINRSWATVAAVTPTTLSIVVPGNIGSGKVTVTTPGGSATSAGDLVIPPAGGPLSANSAATRLSLNAPASTVSVGGSANTLVLFDLTTTLPGVLAITPGTATGSRVVVYAPDGSVFVASTALTGAAQSIPLPPVALSGTYTAVFSPGSSTVGALGVQILGPATTALIVGAAATPISVGAAGVPVLLTFPGTANQTVTVALGGITVPGASVSLISPTGMTLLNASLPTAGLAWYPTLPTTGTYGVLIQPTGSTPGSVSAAVAVTSLGATLTVNQPTAAVSMAAGASQVVSFSGGVGELLSLAVAENAGSAPSASISVVQPGGAVLASGSLIPTCSPACSGTTVVNLGPLPQTGNYLVILQEPGNNSTPLSVTLAAPLPLNLGSASSGSASVSLPGQSVLVSFSVMAGQPFFFSATGLTGLNSPTVADSAGSPVPPSPYASVVGSSNYSPDPAGGTFTALITQSTAQTGTVSAAVADALTATLAVPGQVSLVLNGSQPAALTFSATEGQYFSLAVSETPSTSTAGAYVSAGVISIVAPNGQTIEATGFTGVPVVCTTTDCQIPPKYVCTVCPPTYGQWSGIATANFGPVPMSGTYTFLFQQSGGGLVSFGLATTASATAALGSTVPVSIPNGDSGVVAVFAATAGQNVTVASSAGLLTVIAPNGVTLRPPASSATVANLTSLPLSGSYTVVDQNVSTASVPLTVSTPATGTVVAGTPLTIPLALPGQAAQVSIVGSAGQLLTLSASPTGTVTAPEIVVLNPDRSTLVTATVGPVSIPPLPASGTYTAMVDQQTNGVGTVVLTLAAAQGVTTTQTWNLATTTAGQPAVQTLTLSADQNVSLVLSGLTFSGGVTSALVRVNGPTGGVVASTVCYPVNGACDVGIPTVTGGGTYTVTVTPQGAGTMTGRATLAPWQQGNLVVGTPLPVKLTTVGQNGAWTFAATAGQTLMLDVGSVVTSPLGGTYNVNVTGPTGASLGSGQASAGSDYLLNLPNLAAGTYTVAITTATPQSGSMTVRLINGVAKSLVVNGGGKAYSTGVAGENAYYMINAPRGQPVTLALSGVSFMGGASGAFVNVTGATGVLIAQGSCTAAGCVVGPFAAPTDGPMSVIVSPQGSGTMAFTATVAAVLGGALVPATPQSLALTQAGQAAVLTFEIVAATSQTMSLVLSTTSTTPSSNVYSTTVWNVNGSGQVAQAALGQPAVLDLASLAPGTYTVTVVPQSPATGSVTATLATGVTGALPLGSPQTEALTTVGQNATLSFTLPTAGVPYVVSLVGSSVSPASAMYLVQITAPDGSQAASGSAGAGTTTFNLESAEVGPYTLTLVPQSPSTASFRVTAANGVLSPLSASGAGAAVTTTTLGEDALLSFAATAGQPVTLALSGLAVSPAGVSALTVQIVNPDGTNYNYLSCQMPACELRLTTLQQTGTYTAIVKAGQLLTMSYSVDVTADQSGSLVVNTSKSLTLTAVGQGAQLTYPATTAGQSLVLGVSASAVTPSSTSYGVTVTDPNGNQVGYTIVSSTNPGIFNLPPTVVGTYRIAVVPQFPATGTVALLLSPALVTAVPITGGATPVKTTIAGANATLTFTATAGSSLTLALTGVALTPAGASYLSLQLTNPDGSAFGSPTCQLPACVVRLYRLGQTGTYSIGVNPNSASTLAMSAALVPDAVTTLTASKTATVTLPTVGQSATLKINATAGQSFTLTLNGLATSPAGNNYSVGMYDPTGALILANSLAGFGSTVLPITNATAGTYTVTLVPIVPVSGSFTAVYQ